MKTVFFTLMMLSGLAAATQPSQSTPQSSESTATAIAGAAAGAVSGSQSNATGGDSKAISGSTSEGGDAKAYGGESKSVSGSYSGGSESGSESSAQSDNDVNISDTKIHKYPEIPVNAGVTFAAVCQEGSSSTNSRISIALTTDSVICTDLRIADVYYQIMRGYAESCQKANQAAAAKEMHKSFVASQMKGVASYKPAESVDSSACEKANFYESEMRSALARASGAAEKTHGTGILSKWATQIGIPVTVLATLIMVL